jgi:glutamine synthetase
LPRCSTTWSRRRGPGHRRHGDYRRTGAGQFEINFGHLDDGLRAADWAALFCRSTRGVALKHGYRASFMAKPYLQHPGSGMHVHVSLYDAAGNNLLAANQQQPLRHAVAGCLELLPHSMPIFAPNQNAYRRLGGTTNVATMRAGALKTAMRACAFGVGREKPAHRISPGRCRCQPLSGAGGDSGRAGAWLEAGKEPIPPLNEDRNSGIDFPVEMLEAVRAMQHQPQLREAWGGVRRCVLREQTSGSPGVHAGNQCPGISLVSVTPGC